MNIVIASAILYTDTLNGIEMEDDKCMDEKETTRLEAFSDGVFAVAITFLVLGIHVPHDKSGYGMLLGAVLSQNLTLLPFLTSFDTIRIMWVSRPPHSTPLL